MHPRRQSGFDIPARLTGDGCPLPDTDNWLVVCRACGFHVETRHGHCWKGCPGCGAPLWVVLPGESPLGTEALCMRAEDWHADFKARRRRNAWRTALPTAALADG